MRSSKVIILLSVAILVLVLMQTSASSQTANSNRVLGPQPNLDLFAVTAAQLKSARKAVLFEKFGVVNSNELKASLDGYASELQGDPSAVGYIIVFGKRGRPASESKKRADYAKQYLWNYNRTGNKLVSIDNCYREKVEYELWVVPLGSRPPVTCADKPTPVKRVGTKPHD